MNSLRSSFSVLFATILAVGVVAFISNPVTVFADDAGGGCDFCGGGGSYDWGSSYDNSYDWGSSYDNSYDWGGSFADTSYDWGSSYDNSYDWGNTVDNSYDWGSSYDNSYDWGNQYSTVSVPAPQYTTASVAAPQYTTASVGAPQYTTASVAAPQYNTPSYSGGGSYSRPQTTPVTISRPQTISQPAPVQQRPVTISQPRTITQPTTYSQPTPQYPVSYTQPPVQYPPVQYPPVVQPPVVQPPQQYPAPSCTITIRAASAVASTNGNSQAILTWGASNATSASISTMGTVQTSGYRYVRPTSGQIYTMTVTGRGGTATCQTTAYYIAMPSIQVPVSYPTPIVVPTPISYPTPIVVPTPINYPVPTPVPHPIPVPQPIPTPVPVPVPTPVPGRVSCSITIDRASIINGQSARLSWNSSAGVTRAVLSDGIGSVATQGYLTVTPEASRNYVLTVYGQGTSATCAVSLTVQNRTPHVSLSQIPYTGFDFGTFGNAMYWMALMTFAVSAAYLVLYFQGGTAQTMNRAFAGVRMPRVSLPRVSMPKLSVRRASRARAVAHSAVRTAAPVAQITSIPQAFKVEKVAVARATAPISTAVAHPVLPTFSAARGTNDSMAVIHSKAGEAPRIVITRA